MTPSTSKVLPLLVGAGGILIGALFVWIGLYLWRDGRELRRNGVTVAARVQQKLRKSDGATFGGLESCFVKCSFAGQDGKTNEVELKVQSKVWRQLSEGGSVQLTWLPGQLDSVKVGPLWGRKLRGGIGAVMVGIGIVAAIGFPIGILLEFIRSKA